MLSIFSSISVNSKPTEYLVNDFVWIVKFPHTHQSSEYLLMCNVFIDFDGFV